jgi:large subunit ribosomal protein L28
MPQNAPARRSTRRNWKPNAQRKRVFSDLLNRMLPLSLTTHTLRCIDKAGGALAARSASAA